MNKGAANQVAEDLYTLVGKRCDQQASVIARSNEALHKEGESLQRTQVLSLLLTPVGHTGCRWPRPSCARSYRPRTR